MGLKVLKIKGLGKISVIYASFCAPYKEPGQKHILNIDNYNSDTGVFEITYNKNTPNEKHSYTTWKHVVTQLSTGQWNLQTKLHNQ